MSFRIPLLVCALVCVTACASDPDRTGKLIDRASTSEFGRGVYGCSDTIVVAAEAGVDYERVVGRAMRHDTKALHTLFWLTSDAGFDAASAQGHAAVLGNVLRHVGDGTFGPALNAESETTREAVLDSLRYDFGIDGGLEDEWLTAWYPLTFAPSAGR